MRRSRCFYRLSKAMELKANGLFTPVVHLASRDTLPYSYIIAGSKELLIKYSCMRRTIQLVLKTRVFLVTEHHSGQSFSWWRDVIRWLVRRSPDGSIFHLSHECSLFFWEIFPHAVFLRWFCSFKLLMVHLQVDLKH